ncbi:MAG: FAD:protein FMN transferase [Planctomycetales bacterium]|nr:FAD:protein FMN transferase [Planctomycetales bacterium]NIM08981.1 FAD:protein FMN transferase [Planctomycetales bacterium]NIN08444.1 FAD:protein FMN transferase [Planctomycetales bacterium]NIN77578.1 FAD:protein FMN transferase [Planctomycetales bacterium]NIO34743.1 FAD:protein FMN transferase [Planctomycetales bacterium]
MACRFQVYFNAGQYPDAAQAAMTALDEVDRLESLLSVYRGDSEVSLVNQTVGKEPLPIGPELMELLALALQLHAETGGAFDVTAGPLSEAWGFARQAGRMPGDAQLAAALARVGSGYVEIHHANQTVQFARQGVQLNFGGIGKGYALDVASRLLQAQGIQDFLFHAGRSSVLACGDRAVGAGPSGDGPRREGGWKVGLIHPQRPQVRLAEVRLRDRALATSGSQMQSFHHRGRRYGHILDPRTGRPSSGLLSVTVLAATAAVADALSTALFVMGADAAARFCEQHAQIGAILVTGGAGKKRLQVLPLNLSEADWQLLSD